jgi:cytochrome P450
LLGVPVEDAGKLKVWSDAMLDVVFGDALDRFERARPGVEDMADYFRALCESRRQKPREDVTSYLVQRTSQDEDLALTDDELVGVLTHLLFAGHTTTSDLIGGMMVAFSESPAQQSAIRTHPELSGSAAIEAMRFVTPVKAQPRTATGDAQLSEQRIKQGDAVLPLLIAANRDPATFSNPDEFDIARNPNPQLGFGRGIHFCVGSGIALAETAGFLDAFFGRFKSMEIAVPYARSADLDWHHLMLQRGLRQLSIRGVPA